MKNRIKSTTDSVKNHIHRNRAKYAAVSATVITSYAFISLAKANNAMYDEFLADKGLTDEFNATYEIIA